MESQTAAPAVQSPAVAPQVTESPAPEQQATTPVAPADQQATAPERKLTAREYVEQVKASRGRAGTEQYRATPESPARSAADQPRDEQGRFTTASDPGDETSPAAAQTPDSPAATGPQASGTDGAATAAPDTVRIELPEGHPLRDQGLEAIDAPAALERQYRTLVNAYSRRSEVEQYETRLAETERARALAEAEATALREQVMAAYTSPEVAAKYAELREAWGEEEAQRYLRGVMAEQERSLDERRQQGEQQWREQESLRRGEQFMASAEQTAMQRYPDWWTARPEFGQVFQEVLFQYGNELEFARQRGQQRAASEKELIERLDQRFYADPLTRQKATELRTAKQQAEAKAAEERAAAEARKREEERLAQAAAARARNPFGQIPGSGGVNTAPEEGPTNAREFKEYTRRLRVGG